MEVLTVELQRGHVTPATQLGEGGPGGVGEGVATGLLPSLPAPHPPAQAARQSPLPPPPPIHLEGADEGHRGDRLPGARQAGAEGEFHRLGAYDGPARAIVEQRPIRLLGAGGGLSGDAREGRELWLAGPGLPRSGFQPQALRFTCPWSLDKAPQFSQS